jgi:putative membrane protein
MSITLDLVLAGLHHLGILAVFGVLMAEWAVLHLQPSLRGVELIARVDLGYGVFAGLVLAAGIARVAWGVKGASFYLGNPVFWMKLGLFAVIALISVRPTLNYLRWRRVARSGGGLPSLAEFARTRGWVLLQLGLFAALPILAAMMARGIGY